MAVGVVVLMGLYFVSVHGEEIRDGAYRRVYQFTCAAVAVVFHSPAVAGGVVYIEVVVAAAGGHHVVLFQDIHSFLSGGGSVEDEPYGQSRCDDRLSCMLERRLAVQGQHRYGNSLLVESVQTYERCCDICQRCALLIFRRIHADVVQGGSCNGLVSARRPAVHEHGGRVVLEVIIPSRQDMAPGISDAEGAASEFRRVVFDIQPRQIEPDDGIDDALCICDAAADYIIDAVVICHICSIQIIVFAVGYFSYFHCPYLLLFMYRLYN